MRAGVGTPSLEKRVSLRGGKTVVIGSTLDVDVCGLGNQGFPSECS